MDIFLNKERDIHQAVKTVLALEDYYNRLASEAKITMDIALESEVVLGHSLVLKNRYSGMSSAVNYNVALESTWEAIVEAFKAFLARIIELIKQMIQWFSGTGPEGRKSPLNQLVLDKYHALPGFDHDEESRPFGLIKNDTLSKRLEENEKNWVARMNPLHLDLLNGGDCFKTVTDNANAMLRESVVPKYKDAFNKLQRWEEKAFDEAIDLDTELIKRPKDEVARAREEYKEKVTADADKELESFQPILDSLKERQERLEQCKDGLQDVPQTALRDLHIDPNVISQRSSALKVPEFTRLQKDQTRTLEWVVEALTKVQNDISRGEGVLQICFQAMRSAYMRQLTNMVGGGRTIQQTFASVGTAFAHLLQAEMFFVEYQISRTNILIAGDAASADDWKAVRNSWNTRKEGLKEVKNLF